MRPTRSRRKFLRYRVVATAAGAALLLVGLLPWTVLVLVLFQASGALKVFGALLALLVGLAFTPLLWLARQVLRLAWHPLPVWRGPPGTAGGVIEAEWRVEKGRPPNGDEWPEERDGGRR